MAAVGDPREPANARFQARCSRESWARRPGAWSAGAETPSWLARGTPFPPPPGRIPTFLQTRRRKGVQRRPDAP